MKNNKLIVAGLSVLIVCLIIVVGTLLQNTFVPTGVPGDEQVGTPIRTPVVNISVNPSTVNVGGSSVLSWSAQYVTSCTASGGWSGVQPVQGSRTVNPSGTTTYTLTCVNGRRSAQRSTTLTVTGSSQVSIDFGADITNVDPGAAVSLAWTAHNATSCTASGGWSGSRAVSGSTTVTPTQTTTYNLACSNTSAGQASASVAVTVNGGSTPPTQCSDGVDNDGDGLIDMNDPGCSSTSDNDEYNAPTSGGTTYYLDAINGSDSNAGSSAAPWRTLTKAQSMTHSGDTVVARTGNYGQFTETISAPRTDWITYRADVGQHPVFSGITVGKNSTYSSNIETYYDFDGIEVLPSGPVSDPTSAVVGFSGTNHVILNALQVHANVVGPYDPNRRTDNGARYTFAGSGISVYGDNIAITNNHVYDVYNAALFFTGSHVSVTNNTFNDIGNNGIEFWQDTPNNFTAHTDVLIDRNEIYHLGDCYNHQISDPCHPDALHMYIAAPYNWSNITVSNNFIHDGFTQGIFLGPSQQSGFTTSNVAIRGNIVNGLDLQNVLLGGINGLTLESNTVIGAVHLSGVSNVIQRNNLVQSVLYYDTGDPTANTWNNFVSNGWQDQHQYATGAQWCNGPVSFVDAPNGDLHPQSSQLVGYCSPCGLSSTGSYVGALSCQ